MTLKTLVAKSPDGVVARAYRFAEAAHRGQKRLSGEAYFSHCAAVGESLISWGVDEATIAAGLLHDVIEDTKETEESVERTFGKEITFLVNGVTKLGKAKYRKESEKQRENVKKLILALSEDIRVILVKLADRLHNIETVDYLPREKRRRVALETYEIYAPLAYRLGMQRLAGELEDLSFAVLYPQEYHWLVSRMQERYEERIAYLKRLKPLLSRALADESIEPITIEFRAKRYASLYKKLLRYDMEIEKIYDLIAFRIVVESIADCYATLGIIHTLWPPVPGRIKDYIAMPKPNGYRSLHTVVFSVDTRMVEFQVRTKEMHDEAENGVAAHWAYEEAKGTKGYAERKASVANEREVSWVEKLRAWQEENQYRGDDYMESLKIDFFRDRIFAITPQGEVVDLPSGATPIDFAYQIHSEIGDGCIGARVNGSIVPLDYELRSSDVVEIVTQKGKKPSPTWLATVKTAAAKHHIRRAAEKSDSLIAIQRPQNTELRITATDRIGLLRDITSSISRSRVNIVGSSSGSEKRGAFHVFRIRCETADPEKISKLTLKLKEVRGVREISSRPVA